MGVSTPEQILVAVVGEDLPRGARVGLAAEPLVEAAQAVGMPQVVVATREEEQFFAAEPVRSKVRLRRCPSLGPFFGRVERRDVAPLQTLYGVTIQPQVQESEQAVSLM